MIVPGPHIDRQTLRRASHFEWGPLLRAGVEIHEYQPTMYHCKVMIVVKLTEYPLHFSGLRRQWQLLLGRYLVAHGLLKVLESVPTCVASLTLRSQWWRP
jgi:hypothetical protein